MAASGRTGLAEVDHLRPDAVVLDLHLPDVDGMAWLRLLRRRKPGMRPAVLLFTADWEALEQSSDLAALGATFASKLCDLDEVDHLVESLVAMHGMMCQEEDDGSTKTAAC